MTWEYVMLHHSLTKDGVTVDWQAIRRYHVEVKGWRDVGYHFGVEYVGQRPEVLVGRTLDTPGAHAYQQNMNTRAIGICVVGNFDLVSPPEAMLEATAKLVRWLLLHIGKGKEAVIGHRDVAPKSCPGLFFDLEAFRNRL